MSKPVWRSAATAALVVLLCAACIADRHVSGVSASPEPPVATGSPSPADPAASVVSQIPAAAAPSIPVVELVDPSPPTAFDISGPAFDIQAQVCQMNNVRPLDPPGDQYHTVCWVRDGFGVAPGSNSGGTSYILGHAWAEAELVLNPMSEWAMSGVGPERDLGGIPVFPIENLNNYVVTLTTANGMLRYTVRDAYAVAKDRAAEVQSLMANTPDRVVLISCGVSNGVDVDVNVIVDAYLTAASAAR
jgi:hypothetical protein